MIRCRAPRKERVRQRVASDSSVVEMQVREDLDDAFEVLASDLAEKTVNSWRAADELEAKRT